MIPRVEYNPKAILVSQKHFEISNVTIRYINFGRVTGIDQPGGKAIDVAQTGFRIQIRRRGEGIERVTELGRVYPPSGTFLPCWMPTDKRRREPLQPTARLLIDYKR